MYHNKYQFTILLATGIFLFELTACATTFQELSTPSPETHFETLERDPDVPDLPFPDNPDPSQCGIPTQWGTDESAWVSGYFQGELVQPTVFLYDSHLRLSIAGAIPSGTEVKIILYQQNPSLDFYMVKTVDFDPPQEGWIPAPFVYFEPTN